jgi:tetratricopeptide (TPR) repeat protein
MNRRTSVLQSGLFSRSKDIFVLVSVLGFAAAFLNNSRAASTEDIFKKARGADVEILTQDKAGTPLKTGTGFFVSADGILLTNRHLVEGAASIGAKTEQGGYFFCQGILAAPKDIDLVVLKFEAKDVPFLELASGIHGEPGQKVIVIGNPLGLEGTVSEGIISAIRTDQGLVQISAPISPGSSGSPVLTEGGNVIGVATLQSKDGQNLNFAIPADIVRGVLAGLDPKNAVALTTGNSAIKPDDDLESDFNRAKALLNSDRTTALQLLNAYLLKRPDNADAWIMRAQCRYFKNLSEDAVESAQKAVDLQPGNIHYWRSLIQCLWVVAHGTPDSPAVGTTDTALIARLHRTAEHMLAMGDDFDVTWTSMISTTKALGDTKLAAEFQEEFDRLKNSGEVATYSLDGYHETRIFNGHDMLDCAEVAKGNNLELHEDDKTLTLSGKGHTFNILKSGSGVLVDGVFLEHDLNPYKYKDGRYFLDSDLVLRVFVPVLDQQFGLFAPQIEKVYLQLILPTGISKIEEVASAKALSAAVTLDNKLFEERVGLSSIPGKALLVYLKCVRDDAQNAEYSCMSALGPEVWCADAAEGMDPSQYAGFHVNKKLARAGGRLPIDEALKDYEESYDYALQTQHLQVDAVNLLQICFAQFLHQAAPHAAVIANTKIVSTPFPRTNPTLVITLFVPSAKLESETIFTQVARSLADAVEKFNSQVAKRD